MVGLSAVFGNLKDVCPGLLGYILFPKVVLVEYFCLSFGGFRTKIVDILLRNLEKYLLIISVSARVETSRIIDQALRLNCVGTSSHKL